jgi:hypothetical protein
MSATLSGTLAQLAEVRAQAVLAAALPRRAVVSGGPDQLPSSCGSAEGCPGWTSQVLSPPRLVAGSTYALDVPDAANAYMGRVPEGKTRVIVLGIGESGMVGLGQFGDAMPAGYPRLDGSIWRMNTLKQWLPLSEPTHDPDPGQPSRVSFAGFFCWHMQAALGAGYEVGFLPCGVGGTTSLQWVPGTACYTTAVAYAAAALVQPRTTLGVILHEQGINDPFQQVTGWASRWSTIEAQLRADLAAPSVPLVFVRQQETPPILPNVNAQTWATLLAEQTAWGAASPLRYMAQKPEGPWVETNGLMIHLATSAQIILGQRCADAWLLSQ